MPTPQRSSAAGGFWPHWHDNKLFALLLAILLAYGIVWMAGMIRTQGYAKQMAPSISVTATGEAVLETDLATVDLGVTSSGATGDAAQDANTEKVNALIAKLKEMGVEDRDLQTTNYSIYPQYDYNVSPPTVVGYEATQTVTARIRNKDMVGAILAAAGDLGATNVGNVRYDADDSSSAEAEARAEAIARAHEQAQQIADSLGVQLVDVVSYSESFGEPPYYPYPAADSAGRGGGSPVIEEGEPEVMVTIYVNYAVR